MFTDVYVIMGANYGDEGKGAITRWTCKKALNKSKPKTIVILSNGGGQRGHTVTYQNDICHIYHHFGSGTLDGVDTYIPDLFVINPIVFNEEKEELEEIKQNLPNVYVHENCMVTTPIDMIVNQTIESIRGEDKKHGSCGCGVWETIHRNDRHPLTLKMMIELETSGKFKEKLSEIFKYYINYRLLEEFGTLNDIHISPEWDELLKMSDDLVERFEESFNKFLKSIIIIKESEEMNLLSNFDSLIFENGQGLLIGMEMMELGEDDRYLTPSMTGCTNPMVILDRVLNKCGHEVKVNLHLNYVSRSYLTRHGNGPFKEECQEICSKYNLYDSTNVYNQHQGHLRYGYLNTSELEERIRRDYSFVKNELFDNTDLNLVFTHLDETNYHLICKCKDVDIFDYGTYEIKHNGITKHKKDIQVLGYLDGNIRRGGCES